MPNRPLYSGDRHIRSTVCSSRRKLENFPPLPALLRPSTTPGIPPRLHKLLAELKARSDSVQGPQENNIGARGATGNQQPLTCARAEQTTLLRLCGPHKQYRCQYKPARSVISEMRPYLFLWFGMSFSASCEAKIWCVGLDHELFQRNSLHLKGAPFARKQARAIHRRMGDHKTAYRTACGLVKKVASEEIHNGVLQQRTSPHFLISLVKASASR